MTTNDLTVIIATYGDRVRLATAIQRAAELSDDVRVYAAHAALPVPAAPDVPVVAAVGTAGLATALRGCRAQVLHLHDDVAITPPAVARLRAAHVAHGALVTPLTNDAGTDHAFGALPAVRDAHGWLAAHAPEATTVRPVVAVAPCCLLGAAEHFTALLPFHPAFPGVRLNSVAGDVLCVDGAVAAHDAAEVSFAHLVDDDGDAPLLVASMIVRDEEALLGGCLASLEGVVDRVDVCDTGSVDATSDVLAAHGVTPIHREWRDDFAWARNEVLALAAGATWVLQVDADERVVCDDPVLLRRQLRAAAADFDVLEVTLVDTAGDDTEAARWLSQRILAPRAVHFAGALHEQPARRDGGALRRGSLPSLRLDHLGYTQACIDERGKQDRNLRISELAYARDPSLTTALHYARSLELAGRPAEQRVGLYEDVLARLHAPQARHHAYILAMLANTLLACTEPDTARVRAVAAEALALVPADRIALTAYLRAALADGDPTAALEAIATARTAASLAPLFDDAAQHAAVAWLEAAALHAVDRREDAVGSLAASLRAGVESVELWNLYLQLDPPAAPTAPAAALVLATGSAMGLRVLAERLARTSDGLGLAALVAVEFAHRHDHAGVASFAVKSAVLTGDEDLLDGAVRRVAHLVEPALLAEHRTHATAAGLAWPAVATTGSPA